MANDRMTLVERLRNPEWVRDPKRPRALPHLHVKQTLETMREAADALSAVWAIIGDAARHRTP